MESSYGTWNSPISSQLTTECGVELLDLTVDQDPSFSDTVYWNEIHFDEEGRYVICSSDGSGQITQWTPRNFSARTRVHEYGGGDFLVYQGIVYFSNDQDQALYRQTSPEAAPELLTDSSKALLYADGSYCPSKTRIYCVREDREVVKEGMKEPQNTLAVIDPVNKTQTVLVSGADFYASPRVSPDGKTLAWTQWNHPNMPWDSTEIWTAQLSTSGDEIVPGTAVKVVGGKDARGQDLSVIQPAWTRDNLLLYAGDQTDWWNVYLVTAAGEHRNLREMTMEICGPQWKFGRTSYILDPTGANRLCTTFGGELGLLDMKTSEYQKLETGFVDHSYIGGTAAGAIYCIASSPKKFPQVIRVDVLSLKVDIIRISMKPPVESSYFSIPEKISWPTGNGETCHGLYYAPCNKDFKAPEGELPPLLVRAHGGPTGAFFSALDLRLQYFTTRGFSVLCVDYRGSTGYGKQYRHRLRHQWGILDIEDCSTGVANLVSKRLVDPERICIDGRSAGGYTTLACITFTDTFKVGVSHFGVSDLKALFEGTHKFESRYLDTLLAPSGPRLEQVCKERSPIHFVDRINCALGFFQGDEDKIVPPNQAEMMYNAVKAKGLPTMFVLFKGEQHGFRKAENIHTALDGEFCFFGKVLGFEPADAEIELPIVNL